MSETSIFEAAKRVVYESRKVYDRYPGLLEEVAKLGVPEDDPFNVAMVDLEAICTQAAKPDKGGLTDADMKAVKIALYGGKRRDGKAKKVIYP